MDARKGLQSKSMRSADYRQLGKNLWSIAQKHFCLTAGYRGCLLIGTESPARRVRPKTEKQQRAYLTC